MRITCRFQEIISVWVSYLLATALSAPTLREGDYFRPLAPQGSGRVGTTAAYRRSPCPAVNALANHGYISRDGKAITAQALKDAVMKFFNVDNRYADTLVVLARKPVFDLDELSVHNMVEHDMSLVHKDAFFGHDPAQTDPELLADLFGHVGASGVLDPWFFARTQRRRLRDCIVNNPQCEFSNAFLLSVTLGRQGLLMRVMGGQNEEAVDIEVARMLLQEEKLNSSAWTRSKKPISQDDIQYSRERLFALLKASREWFGDGVATSSQQLISDANPSLCLQMTNKTLTLAICDHAASAQNFQLSSSQRLVTAAGNCVEVAARSNAAGAQIVGAKCSETATATQQWRYDASGRLRPVHTPDLCIDLQTTAVPLFKVVTAACSTRAEQRFYSIDANFQPSVSSIASVTDTERCLSLDSSAATSSALDLSPVIVAVCDPIDTTQPLILDELQRLVFAYDRTQCVDVDAASVSQKPCSDDSSNWFYDSLSRLHPGVAPSKCLAFPTEGQRVGLVDCADGQTQKWFIASTKATDIRPTHQYYRPNVFESSGKPGTSATYSRSPCPALNTLANHGLLPRSGRNLTADQVKQAVIDHFNIDSTYAQALVELARKKLFNLDDLSIHNAAEHDMSLVHADAFFGQDPAVIDPSLAADLMRHVGSTGKMDVLFFARTQARRLKDCQARNPQCDFSDEFLMSVALGRMGLLLRALGGEDQNAASADLVRSFVVDEKFPTDFKKSSTAITQTDIQATRSQIDSLLRSSSDWLANGFLTSSESTLVVSESGDHTKCLAIAKGSTQVNAALVVANCDKNRAEQRFAMDNMQRIVGAKSGLCLGAAELGTSVGTAVVQLECVDDASNQLWTYDSSGRLRPANAASLCLEVSVDSEDSQVVLNNCDATRQQRFYSIYVGFTPEGSHLNSIEFAEFCLSVKGASKSGGATVSVATCDPLMSDQQLMLNDKGLLVFKHSELCLTARANSTIQATCAGGASQTWLYDSLGRLHPASNPTACLEVRRDTSTGLSIALAACTDNGAQQWYASDAKDPNRRPLNAFYRPNREEASGRFQTAAIYSRSPCPALNALANHGIVSRDGRNISRFDLISAVIASFNLEEALVEKLMAGVTTDVVHLHQFSDPRGGFEFKGSLVHSSAFFSPDPAAIDPDLVNDFFASVGSDDNVDLVYFAAALRSRLDEFAFDAGVSGTRVTANAAKYLKPGLMLRVMSGANGEVVSADFARSILVKERLPGMFLKPSVAVTVADAMDSAAKVQAMVETGATSSTGAGGSSEAWLSRPFRPKKEQIFLVTSTGVSCLSLADGALTSETCDATKLSQLFTYDADRRLIVESTSDCLDVIDGKLGDLYDSTGRLHPLHGPKFCLDVATGSHAVVNKCSNRSEQLFFASFTKLALDSKQLVAVASSAQQSPLTECLSSSGSSGIASLRVEQCSETTPKQLFSLDDAQRLVDQSTKQCAAIIDAAKVTRGVSVFQAECGSVSQADCGRVSQADCGTSADAQKWTYDSVGRMHLTTSMEMCLTAGAANAVDAATLDLCSMAASQRWMVAKLTARASSPSDKETSKNSTSRARLSASKSAFYFSVVVLCSLMTSVM